MGINSCGTTLIDEGTFKNIGAITWDTTAKTAGFTAVGGNGYFVNTTSGAITVTLPSSPTAGDAVAIADYANTADTNNITIGRNGSNIQGTAKDFIINTEGASVLLIYVDATKGWLLIDAAKASDISEDKEYIVATGGTVTTVGDYKFHRFTGPGTFTVCSVGNAAGSNTVDTVVVAGGAGGGYNSGGGGAGGLRDITSIPVTATGYPITVGGGGSGGTLPPPRDGGTGSNSVAALSTSYTSAGGGGGGNTGVDGGSGGGSGAICTPDPGGVGNTPPVSPPQGNPGGAYNICGYSCQGSTGGGGATTAGTAKGQSDGAPGTAGGNGTDVSSNYPGQPNSGVYAGGGGGGACFSGTGGSGGPGGGGNGGGPGPDTGDAGTTNTGGGGGGGTAGAGGGGGNGGSGIIIIRYKYQN
jgi:hypothetical protein